MCGVFAVYSAAAAINSECVEKALETLSHRGPDFRSHYISDDGKVALGHTLLAIADAPKNSQQPLQFEHLRMTYNGEIYNTAQISRELRAKGATLTTTSDSEILIKAIYYFGLSYLSKVHGCYAFVIFDSQQDTLFFGRDPYGEKQLVWTQTSSGMLAISSEAKALKHLPGITLKTRIDRVWQDFIFDFYSPRDETYFENIHNAKPGTIYAVRANAEVVNYMTIPAVDPVSYSHDALFDAMAWAVKSQVPSRFTPAVILSGGLDSSIVTALLDKQVSGIQAFTAHYQCADSDDFVNARKLVSALENTTLHPVCISHNDGVALFSKVTYALEEPLLDQVYISQYLLYKSVAEKGVRVALNGQGADEFWCGYNYHYDFPAQIEAMQAHQWQAYYFKKAIDAGLGLLLSDAEITAMIEQHLPGTTDKEPLEVLTQFSVNNHLQAMLCHEDRLSMASSVETRLPFLDRRVTSLAMALAAKEKIVEGVEKKPLRLAFEKSLPAEIAQRRKLAFPDAPEKNYEEIVAATGYAECFDGIFSGDDFKQFQLHGKNPWRMFGVNAFDKVFSR